MKTRQAEVTSSDGRRSYIVSIESTTGEWQCACVGWTRHVPRRDCKHIRSVKQSRPAAPQRAVDRVDEQARRDRARREADRAAAPAVIPGGCAACRGGGVTPQGRRCTCDAGRALSVTEVIGGGSGELVPPAAERPRPLAEAPQAEGAHPTRFSLLEVD